MDRRKEINASHLIAALGGSCSVISFWRRKGFAVKMEFGGVENGNIGKRYWVMGVLCAKSKLHKIAPDTQGIRFYDVMLSGEVLSFALRLILKKIGTDVCVSGSPGTAS